jgi:hypothetical protein
MSLSNRVSLDTNILFVRDMFMFSTNNIPISTNYVLGAGPNGNVYAQDTLRNIEAYGVGYLPSTFSTTNGQINSVSQTLLSGVVTTQQLTSSQSYLLGEIAIVQGNVDTLSTYILTTVLPSSFTSYNNSITYLNSSFQGYVVASSVTAAQLISTGNGCMSSANVQISSLSTVSYTHLTAADDYMPV